MFKEHPTGVEGRMQETKLNLRGNNLDKALMDKTSQLCFVFIADQCFVVLLTQHR